MKQETHVRNDGSKFRISTQTITKVAVLSAISFVLTKLVIPLPIFPSFLKMEMSDIPAVIGALAISPVAGVLIELIKNLIDLIVNPVGYGIGQLANFTVGCALILPVWFVYSRKKTLTSFIIGSILGVVVMVLIACVANYYVLIPVYAKVFGQPIEFFVEMTRKVNGLVTDFKMLIVFAIAPFNLIKGVLASIAGFLLLKALKHVPYLHL